MQKKNFSDYFSLAITTVGVGYLPLAPGTWGSMVGVLIYLVFAWNETAFLEKNPGLALWITIFNAVAFVLFNIVAIRTTDRSCRLFNDDDPSQAVIDEVSGQLLTFMFIPFTFSWTLILAGFLFFRLFDIWKPYPIDSLQDLSAGLGVMADDILAGVYAGICLLLVYTVSLSL